MHLSELKTVKAMKNGEEYQQDHVFDDISYIVSNRYTKEEDGSFLLDLEPTEISAFQCIIQTINQELEKDKDNRLLTIARATFIYNAIKIGRRWAQFTCDTLQELEDREPPKLIMRGTRMFNEGIGGLEDAEKDFCRTYVNCLAFTPSDIQS